MKKRILAAALSGMLLCACGAKNESSANNESSGEMQYIKTSVLYDTLVDMYDYPDQYLGKKYHIVGLFYPSTGDDGNTIYSVYAKQPNSDHGIGLELEWSDFSGLKEYDKITVEGVLEQRTGSNGGMHIEYLVLNVSSLEKRE